MQELSEEEIEAQARAIVSRATHPRRRPRPRVADPLRGLPQQIVDTPAGGVAAWRLGEGPATLVVHGWEDDHAVWSPLIERFAAAGRAIVAMDLPAHGLSPATSAEMAAWGQAVRAVAEALAPVDAVIAHSMGVSAALTALDGGLKVRAFVSVAPPLPTKPHLVRPRPPVPNVAPAVQARVVALNEERRAKRAAGFAIDPEAVCAKQTGRALFVHDNDDELWLVEGSRLMAQAWPGAELLVTDGLGHRKIARNQEIIARILAFIEADA